MKGVQLTGHGGPEKLVWNDTIPTPRPGPEDVLVRVIDGSLAKGDKIKLMSNGVVYQIAEGEVIIREQYKLIIILYK